MKTKIKAEYGPPLVGQKRIIDKFAWLPTQIITYEGLEDDGRKLTNYYWIWLENYKEEQIYSEYKKPGGYRMFYTKRAWFVFKKYQWKEE